MPALVQNRFRILVSTGLTIITFFGHSQSLKFPSLEAVNSPYDEMNPVLSPDGMRLYFTRANHPENIGGKSDPGDIWISVRTDQGWSAPLHAGAVINDASYNAVLGFSFDGSLLFLNGHYSSSSSPARTQGISVSRWTGAGWGRPENIYIPFFLNRSPFQSGFISADGNVLVYSAEAYGSYGVEDIYVSLRMPDGKWSEPRNVGPTINTRFQELCPSLSEDGSRLFFATNGRGGLGSFDIFYADRLDDSFTRWSEPVNLGAPVNTEGRELFFRIISTGGALLTTTKDSDGYGDIRFYDVQQPFRPDTVVTFLPHSYPEGTGKLHLYGFVTDALSAKPIPAQVIISGVGQVQRSIASAENGYSVHIPAAGVFTIEVVAEGYIKHYEELDLQTREVRDLELNYRLQPIAVGTTVTLQNILFKQGTAELLPESYIELDRVAEFLKSNPTVEIELSGHTDNRGSYRALMELSQKRVDRVKRYLVDKGISSRRITGRGYGGTRPIASNDTEESRQLNRRVEFTIKKR